jgi:hypothetical protein
MDKDSSGKQSDSLAAKIAKVEADAEAAKRRATTAVGYVTVALKLAASTPRFGVMLREIDKELENTSAEVGRAPQRQAMKISDLRTSLWSRFPSVR